MIRNVVEKDDRQQMEWEAGLRVWREALVLKQRQDNAKWLCNVCGNQNYPHRIICNGKDCAATRAPKPVPTKVQQVPSEITDTPNSFRVTCKRSGMVNKCYPTMELAGFLGGAIMRKFGWKVAMKEYDVEVFLFLNDTVLCILLELPAGQGNVTSQPYIRHPGLVNTVSYAMAHYADVQPGEIVLDPMCGKGILSMHVNVHRPGVECLSLCGDLEDSVLQLAKENVRSFERYYAHPSSREKNENGDEKEKKKAEKYPDSSSSIHPHPKSKPAPISVLAFDSTALPFRSGSIDKIIVDLPWVITLTLITLILPDSPPK